MNFKFLQHKENIYSGFWVLPFIALLIVLCVSSLTLYLDSVHQFDELSAYLRRYVDYQNAREILSIIATSVITVTSVTFSVTVLTLTVVSNQLGSRLLPSFMGQKPTQYILGFFIGTFLYCIVDILFMKISAPLAPIPYLSFTVAILMGVVAFFLLIYFIHYVCHTIQIDNILNYFLEGLLACIDNQLSRKDESPDTPIHKALSQREDLLIEFKQYGYSYPISSEQFGYIQTIDLDSLLECAISMDFYIYLDVELGDFVFEGTPIMTLYGKVSLNEKIDEASLFNCIRIGNRRSIVQDIEFAFEQLSEVAIRALSPSVNDPYMAIHTLERIGQGIVRLDSKSKLAQVLVDDDNTVRLLRDVVSFDGILHTAFDRLRQQARFDMSVAIHLLNIIKKLFFVIKNQELRDSLFKQAKLIFLDASKNDLNDLDRSVLEKFYDQVLEEHNARHCYFTFS